MDAKVWLSVQGYCSTFAASWNMLPGCSLALGQRDTDSLPFAAISEQKTLKPNFTSTLNQIQAFSSCHRISNSSEMFCKKLNNGNFYFLQHIFPELSKLHAWLWRYKFKSIYHLKNAKVVFFWNYKHFWVLRVVPILTAPGIFTSLQRWQKCFNLVRVSIIYRTSIQHKVHK